MALVSFQDLSSQEAGNPYTTPVQPLSFDDFTTTSSGLPDLEPLNFCSQEVTSTGVTQYVNYTTTQTNTVHRNNTTFEEMVVTSVCYQKHILHDGTVLENESKLAIRSWTDEHGNYHWVDDDNKQGTRDHQGQTESTENHFSCSDRLVEETNYRRFYTTFEPEQFAVEDMVFEYMEDHREFELYDFAVNFPDQTDVLCKNNLSKLIDKIVPFAEEQGRLEDVNMLASSHVYDYQLNVRRGQASSSEMMQLNMHNGAQLCLEYIPMVEKETAPEELATLSSVAEAESVVLTDNDLHIKTPCSLDSSCSDLGLKDMFMSPPSSSSSLSAIDSTSSCYDLKDLFMSPSSSFNSINSTSSCYGLKDLFMSPSSSSSSLSTIDSTLSCYGLKDLFMSPSSSFNSIDSTSSCYGLKDLFMSPSSSSSSLSTIDSTSSCYGLKDLFMSPSSSFNSIDSTSSCYGLKDLFMSPSSSSSSLSTIDSTSSCYGLKDLFMSPSSSSSSLSTIFSTSSCYGLKDLFMSPSSSFTSISNISFDAPESTSSSYEFKGMLRSLSSTSFNISDISDSESYGSKDMFDSSLSSNDIASDELVWGTPCSQSSDVSSFKLFGDVTLINPCGPIDASDLPTEVTCSAEAITPVSVSSADVIGTDEQQSACEEANISSSLVDVSVRKLNIDTDSRNCANESTLLEEMEIQEDVKSASRSKPSRIKRLGRYLKRFNVFSGVICSKIVRSFVQNHLLL